MENVENLIKKLVKLLNIKSNQIENVYVIKLQELFMDLLIRKEKFQDAIEIAKKLIHSYEYIFFMFKIVKGINFKFDSKTIFTEEPSIYWFKLFQNSENAILSWKF